MDENQILIDYTQPTWREWLFKFLDGVRTRRPTAMRRAHKYR